MRNTTRRTVMAGAIAAALALPFGASAQDKSSATFDIYLRGIKAAQLALSSVEDGGRYSATARMQTTGLLGWLRTVSYEAQSQGRVTGSNYVPSLYQESGNNDGKLRSVRMAYRNGVPQERVTTPPKPADEDDLDPASQGGTWDIMTALHAVLRDMPREEVCSVNKYLFDGRRRMQIVQGKPVTQGDKITCNAEYRRVAGYPASEMAERSVFPFRLTYAPTGSGEWHVVEVAMETTYGTGSMVRR